MLVADPFAGRLLGRLPTQGPKFSRLRSLDGVCMPSFTPLHSNCIFLKSAADSSSNLCENGQKQAFTLKYALKSVCEILRSLISSTYQLVSA